MPQKFQHHGAAPNLADGIGDMTTGNVGRRAMHRLKQRRELALGVEIGAGRDALQEYSQPRLVKAPRLHNVQIEQFGEDVMWSGYLKG